MDGSAAPVWLPRWVPAHLGSYSLCGERAGNCPLRRGQDGLTPRQNAPWPRHTFLQASVSSIKWGYLAMRCGVGKWLASTHTCSGGGVGLGPPRGGCEGL